MRQVRVLPQAASVAKAHGQALMVLEAVTKGGAQDLVGLGLVGAALLIH
jgi:hypothetical protein